jgi:type I restriction enzyme S subunit
MNHDLLLAHFNRISDAPDAIPRLRQFVLDLAIRGKLVEQDPKDEPASALLRRIQLKKTEIAKEAHLKKEKPLPPLEGTELPFNIPKGWHWSQLAQIGFINPRNTVDDGLQSSFVPMSLISSEYGVANTHEVRPWGEIKKGFTHFANGDVALAKITPCFENGKSTIFRGLTGGVGAGTTELHVVRPVIVCPDYVLIFLKCPHFIESGIPRMTGTAGQKRVSTEYFAHSPFPLAPLAEQHRIVAKVDELMSLCDRLEAEQREREARRARLTAASHHHLNNGTNAETLRKNAKFFVEHLPRLTARPDHITQLRQTILSLAVRAQLVPQDACDEPILSTIRQLKPAFRDQGVPLNDSGEFEAAGRHILPSGWAWIKGKWIADFIDPQPSHRTPPEQKHGVPYIGYADITDKGAIDFLNARRVSASVLDEQRQRYSLYNREDRNDRRTLFVT